MAGLPRDPGAFEALVRDHAGAVFGFVLRRVGDRSRAEDLAQETFLRAWRAREGFRGEATSRAWLMAIASNVIRDDARRRRRRPEEVEPAFGDVPATGADPAARAEHAEAIERLREALGQMNPAHREIFLLRERDGLSYAEIARVLRVPIGSVMSGLSRARERLLKAVEG